MWKERWSSCLYRKIVIIIASAIGIPSLLIYLVVSISSLRAKSAEYEEKAVQQAQSVMNTLENGFDQFVMLAGSVSELSWLREVTSNYPMYCEPYETSVLEQQKIKSQMRVLQVQSPWQSYIGLLLEEKNVIISSQLWGEAEYYFTQVISMQKPEEAVQCLKEADGFEAFSLANMNVGAAEDWIVISMPVHLSTYKPVTLFQCIHPMYLKAYIEKLEISGLISVRIENGHGEKIYEYCAENQNRDGVYAICGTARNMMLSFEVHIEGECIGFGEMIFSMISGILAIVALVLTAGMLIGQIVYGPIFRLTFVMRNEGQRDKNLLLNALVGEEEIYCIEQAIIKMKVNQENTLKELERYRGELRTNFVRNLVMGYYDHDEILEKRMQDLRIPFCKEDAYLVCVMLPMDVEVIGRLIFAGKVWSNEREICAELCRVEDAIAIIFCLNGKWSKEAIRREFGAFFNEINERYTNSLTLLWGMSEKGYEGIAKSYQSAINEKREAANAIAMWVADESVSTWTVRLAVAIAERNAETAQEVLRMLSGMNQSLSERMRVQLKVFEVVLGSVKGEGKEEALQSRFGEIVKASDKESWRILGQLVQDVAEECNESNVSLEVIRYIDAHYMETTLSLKELSSVFHFSVPQMSKIVKQAAQVTFLEYLHTLRIMRAKMLMHEGMDDLKEVGYSAGFDNIATFVRVFTKQEQMSPKKYLTMIRKMN